VHSLTLCNSRCDNYSKEERGTFVSTFRITLATKLFHVVYEEPTHADIAVKHFLLARDLLTYLPT